MDNQHQNLREKSCDFCGKVFHTNRWNKRFCSLECQINRNSKSSKKNFKPKKCINCDTIYTPTGNASKYCPDCKLKIHKEKLDISNLRYRSKHQKVGVGYGGNQGKGKTHHSYKNGIGGYKKYLKEKCERCNENAVLVHHIDRDRTNNEPENLESLCKRCHQIEHKCWESFSQT